MYIRIKKINGSFYAYLVECKWNRKNKKPIQRSKKCLGKIYSFNKIKNNILSSVEGSEKEILDGLIENELLNYGFQFENGYINGEVIIDLNSLDVKNKKGNDVVVKLNEGYICKDNLVRLYNFKDLNNLETIRAGEELGKRLLDCGISINNEIFIELFRRIYKNI